MDWGLLWGEIQRLSIQHMILVAVGGGMAIVVGVPAGILISRPAFSRFAQTVVGVASVGQTVPSLAVVGIMMPLLGVGFKPAVFALFVYALLPVVLNTYAGIRNIDPSIIEAGRGMGMTGAQILFKVELPLAFSVIMAGIRTAMVICVGTATFAHLIGGGGLGDLIFLGIALLDMTTLLAGAIPAAILAILVDFLFGRIVRACTPRGIAPASSPEAAK